MDLHLLVSVELDRQVFVFLLQFLFLDRHLLHDLIQFLPLAQIPIEQTTGHE